MAKNYLLALITVILMAQTSTAQITRLPQQVESKGIAKAKVSLLKNIKAKPDSKAHRPGKILRIRDIAKVYSSDESLRAAIEDLDIENWPKPSEATTVTKSHVKLRLQLEGYDSVIVPVVGWNEVKIHGPQANGMNGKEETLRSKKGGFHERLTSAIQEHVKSELGLSNDDVVVVNVDDKIRVSNSNLLEKFDGSIEIISGGDLLIGTKTIEFVLVDANSFSKGTASASIFVGKNTNVATRLIKRGEIISTANVRRKKFFFNNGAIRNATGIEVFGKYAGRDIQPAAQIRTSDLISTEEKSKEIIVRKGTVVTAIAKRANVEIKMANAICTEQGRIGDVISVQNSRSKKTFPARVISSNEVVLN